MNDQGQALSELIIILLIFSILLLVGVPKYVDWVRHTGIERTIVEILNDLRFAQLQAKIRGRNIEVRFSETGYGVYDTGVSPAERILEKQFADVSFDVQGEDDFSFRGSTGVLDNGNGVSIKVTFLDKCGESRGIDIESLGRVKYRGRCGG
jgi:type II secretory pathway pseudopilin PulG